MQISCNLPQDFQYGNTSSSVFSNFQAISLSELSDIILNMKSTTCSCDVVPTKLLKDVLPSLLSIINGSLQTGIVPSCLKKAAVQPLLKKNNLDPTELNNYRPMLKLPFLHSFGKGCNKPDFPLSKF